MDREELHDAIATVERLYFDCPKRRPALHVVLEAARLWLKTLPAETAA